MGEYPSITLPPDLEGVPIVASVSGGKDSTALMLALNEAGIEHRRVFADTGWEAAETYKYLDTLRRMLGQIDVVGYPGGMPQKIRERAGFPSRRARWCTEELKLRPIWDYHAKIGDVTASAVGVRGEESAARAGLGGLSPDRRPGGHLCWTWRPLISWTVEDVIRIHLAHSVPMNPLYKRGHDRVGCWPCVMSRKSEIRAIADHDPERIDQIEALEKWATEERARRNAETPGRYTWEKATMFLGRGDGPLDVEPGIRDVVSWSRTSRGGVQLELIDDGPQGGCMRWGLCEAHEGDDD